LASRKRWMTCPMPQPIATSTPIQNNHRMRLTS
jgi:hypothetical protein